MITSKGNGKFSFVPWTWSINNLLATLITGSFFINSNSKVTQNAEFASTFKITLYFFDFSSSNFIAGWFGITFSFTPSESVFYPSFPKSFISKKKFMFEQFLNGIFIMFLLGIFIIFCFVPKFYISFMQIICGTSPRLLIGIIIEVN